MVRSERAITSVARHSLEKCTLSDKRDREIVRAPDERYAESKRICSASLDARLDFISIVTSQFLLDSLIDKLIQTKMADVHEWIILVVANFLLPEPAIGRSQFSVTHGIIDKLTAALSAKQLC